MEYLIKFPKGSNIALILALLKEFNVQIEPNVETDWFNELSPEQQTSLKAAVKEIEDGTAKFVSDEHVRDRVKQFFEQKRGEK